jgi:hypothetical protein
MKKIFIVLCLLGLTLAGCGYSTHSSLPSNWRTIYIAPFENKVDYTTEGKRNLYLPMMEVKVRSAIINRYQFDGALKVAKEDTASLVLKGELVDYQRDVLRYTDENDVKEYRVRVVVNMKLTEGVDGPKVWEENGFSGEATYFLSGAQASSESAAVDNAITDLARRTVERTVENW